jgi:hypothetical protein
MPALSADEFKELCRELDLPPSVIARFLGSKERPVLRWLDGSRDVPEGVALLLCITKAIRGRTRYSVVARLLHEEAARFDRLAAEFGDYPEGNNGSSNNESSLEGSDFGS